MALSAVRRVFSYAGAIFLVLLLAALLLASLNLLELARAYLVPNKVRKSLMTDSLHENSRPLCHSSFMASHTVLRSYLCSGIGELLAREAQIVPPLGETGCENLRNLDRVICNGQFLRTIVIVASVSGGVMVFLLSILVVWTVVSWIIAVRPSYVKKRAAQFARAMDKSRRARGIIGTEESLEEGTMKYPQFKERRPRITQKHVMFRGVRALLPWGKGSEWSQAVGEFVPVLKDRMTNGTIQEVEVVRRGIMPGFIVGMKAPQIDMNIIEPGELERGDLYEHYSGSTASEESGSNATTRVVSTGHEMTRLGSMEVRKRSGLGDGFPNL